MFSRYIKAAKRVLRYAFIFKRAKEKIKALRRSPTKRKISYNWKNVNNL